VGGRRASGAEIGIARRHSTVDYHLNLDVIWSRKQWQKAFVVTTKPTAFLWMIISVWFGVFMPLKWIHLWSWTSGPAVQTVSIYRFGLPAGLAALSLSFKIAILIRIGTLLKNHGQSFWASQTPPYGREIPIERPLPIPYYRGRRLQKKKSNAVKWFVISASTFVVSLYLYLEWIMFSEFATFIDSTISSNLAGILTAYLGTLPTSPVTQSTLQGMDPYAIVFNFFLAWLPAIPLVIMFMNVNSYLFEIYHRFLYIAFGRYNG